MEEAFRLIFKYENFDTYNTENTLRDYRTRTKKPNKSSTADMWPAAQAFKPDAAMIEEVCLDHV